MSGPKRALDYPKLSNDSYVIWHTNGIFWPDERRSVAYLSHKLRHPMLGFDLWTVFWSEAARFDTEGQARAYWAEQDELRRATGYSLADNHARLTTIAELKRIQFGENAPGHPLDIGTTAS